MKNNKLILEILISLLIGITLWFIAVLSNTYEVKKKIEIVYTGIPDTLTFTEPPPTHIPTLIKADGKSLFMINFLKPKLIYEFSKKIKKGKNVIKIKNAKKMFPEILKIEKIEFLKKEFLVKIDRKIEKKLPVSVRIKGKPRTGFVANPKTPSIKIKVEGPEILLKNIDTIKTDFISVEGREKSFETYARLLSPSKVVKIDPESIKVNIVIEKIEEKEFKNIPISVLKPPSLEVKIFPEEVYLRISGPASKIKMIKKEDIKTIINCMFLNEGEYLLKPDVYLPDDISLTKIQPEFIRVNLNKRKSK